MLSRIFSVISTDRYDSHATRPVCPADRVEVTDIHLEDIMKRFVWIVILVLIPLPLIACNASSVMNHVKYSSDSDLLAEAVELAEIVTIEEGWTNQAATLAAAGTILAEWQWRPGVGLDDDSTMAIRLGSGWYLRTHPGADFTIRAHAVFHGQEWDRGRDFQNRNISGWWFEPVATPPVGEPHAG